MARRCTVCAHPDRPAIDQALVNRRSFRTLAERFGLGRMALVRHHDDHLPVDLAQAKAAADVAQSDDLLAQIVTLKARAMKILDRAEKADKFVPAIMAIREARECVELLAEMVQAIDRRPTLNLLVAPEWLAARSVLLDALRPYPEARAAVAARLVALEASA